MGENVRYGQAESLLLDKGSRGGSLDLRPLADRRVRPEVIARLLFHPPKDGAVSPLRIIGADVGRTLMLNDLGRDRDGPPPSIVFERCLFRAGIELRRARLGRVSLARSRFRFIDLDQAEIEDSLDLSGEREEKVDSRELSHEHAKEDGDFDVSVEGWATVPNGPFRWVRARGARISGSVLASYAWLGGEKDARYGDPTLGGSLALDLSETRIGGSVHLSPLFIAVGGVSLAHAQIGGRLNLDGARLRAGKAPALNLSHSGIRGSVSLGREGDDTFVAEGRVEMEGARIVGGLLLAGARFRSLMPDEKPPPDSVEVRLRPVALGPQLLLPSSQAGLSLAGATVGGDVVMDDVVSQGTINLASARVAGSLSVENADVRPGPNENFGLFAPYLQLEGALDLAGTIAGVNLVNAHLGSDAFVGADLLAPDNDIPALRARGLTVAGSLWLSRRCAGEIDLRSVRTGANLTISDLRMTGDHTHINLAGGAVAGQLRVEDITRERALVTQAPERTLYERPLRCLKDGRLLAMASRQEGDGTDGGYNPAWTIALRLADRHGELPQGVADEIGVRSRPLTADDWAGLLSLSSSPGRDDRQLKAVEYLSLVLLSISRRDDPILLAELEPLGRFIRRGNAPRFDGYRIGVHYQGETFPAFVGLSESGEAHLYETLEALNAAIGVAGQDTGKGRSDDAETTLVLQRLAYAAGHEGDPLLALRRILPSDWRISTDKGLASVFGESSNVIDLEGVKAGAFHDDGSCGDAVAVRLDGFVYDWLSREPAPAPRNRGKAEWKTRRDWLSRQFPNRTPTRTSYTPHPYTQMAKALRGAGLYLDATRITSARLKIERDFLLRQDLRRDGLTSFAFGWLMWTFQALNGLLFNFGLSARRALVSFLVFVVLGWFATLAALSANVLVVDLSAVSGQAFQTPKAIRMGVPREKTTADLPDVPCGEEIEPFVYAADVFIPLIDLRQEPRCTVRSAPQFWPWRLAKALYAVLGWIVTSMTILTVSGVLRRQVES